MSFPLNRPVLRDSRTGQIKKGSPPLNPGGRPKTRPNRKILEDLIGEGGRYAYERIKAIAEGEISIETLAREPKPHEDSVSVAMIPTVRKVPSIRERLDAWIILAEHLNGKAPAALDVTIDDAREPARANYRTLSDSDLANLEGLLRKAKSASEEEIDAEIVEPVPERPALPADTTAPETVTDDELAACLRAAW